MLLFAVLFVQRPSRISINPGSLTISTVALNNERFIAFSSDAVNCIGDMQWIGFNIDEEKRHVFLTAFVIRRSVFEFISAHNDWPLLVRERIFLPGKYDVLVWNNGKFVEATSFNAE